VDDQAITIAPPDGARSTFLLLGVAVVAALGAAFAARRISDHEHDDHRLVLGDLRDAAANLRAAAAELHVVIARALPGRSKASGPTTDLESSIDGRRPQSY
jgi:hypothetical protein